jgi:hypothetical protein
MKRSMYHPKIKQKAAQLHLPVAHAHNRKKEPVPPNNDSVPDMPQTETATASVWFEHKWQLMLLVSLPWVILLINPNWPFQGFNHMDPWYYFGSFTHFPHYQRLMPNYAGERLPWILPGYLLTRILPAAYASMVLHILCFYVSVFSVYYIVRRYAGFRAGLLTAALLGCHGLFVGANGWDYVDGGCIAYESLTFALLAAADRSLHPRLFIILAGMASAGLLYTYPQWAGFVPAFFFFYLHKTRFDFSSSYWRVIHRKLWSFGMPFFVGFLLVTGILTVIHLLTGGHGFFYKTSIDSILGLWKAKANPNNTQDFRWMLFASWLVFPILAFIVSLGAWLQHWRRKLRLSKPAQAVIGSYLYSFLFLVLLTLRSYSLEWDYVASILIPGVFLVLGMTVFSLSTKAIGNLSYAVVLIICCGICLYPLSTPGSYRWLLFHGTAFPVAPIAAVGAAARLGLPRRIWTWPLVVGSVCCCSFAVVPAYPGLAWQTHYNGLAAQERIASAIRIVQKRIPPDRYPAFWINNVDDRLTAEYRAIMCSFLAHGLSMFRYPKLDRVYPPGTFIVIVTRESDAYQTANQTMSHAGMPLLLVSRDVISGDGVTYQITCVKVQPQTSEHHNAQNSRARSAILRGPPLPVPQGNHVATL